MKEISIDTTIHDLTEAYPELIPVLVGLGFAGVADPAMRASHGKIMTIRKGCQMLGKDTAEVARVLEQHGFALKG